MSNSTPESRAAERDAIAAKYGVVPSTPVPSHEAAQTPDITASSLHYGIGDHKLEAMPSHDRAMDLFKQAQAAVDEADGAPHGAHLVTDPTDSLTNRLMEMDKAGELEVRPSAVQRKLDSKAQELTAQVRHAMAGIGVAVYEGLPPAEADITTARNSLEALITMARDWSR
jgi:hypothetical protein